MLLTLNSQQNQIKTYVNGQIVSLTNNTTTTIAAVQADVDANEAAPMPAIALKEDAVNKSTDATLADATNFKFPTELAVKTTMKRSNCFTL